MVDQIGTENAADELIGDDRPPSRRPSAFVVLLVLVLGGFAVARLLDPHGAPQAAPAARGVGPDVAVGESPAGSARGSVGGSSSRVMA